MTADSSGRNETTAPAGQPEVSFGEDNEQLQRIRRLGRKLFGVANCVVVIGDAPTAAAAGSMNDIETAFCLDIGASEGAVAVLDTSAHRTLGQHRHVAGKPYIRFFASHPVHAPDKSLAGRICLVDYTPRPAFREGDRQSLADLAALVERELELHSINASQLDLQKKNKNLRRKSLIDPLIGTWNRGAIMRILTIEAVRCDKAGVPLSLIVVDLDFFKKINDTYGHPAGDAVLVKVASRLRSCIRPQEALGRYGGEEFLIVLPGSSHKTAMAVAERMRAAVASQPEVVNGASLNLTMSAGIASTDVFPTATTEELISKADMALYAAKDAGRNRVINATPDLS